MGTAKSVLKNMPDDVFTRISAGSTFRAELDRHGIKHWQAVAWLCQDQDRIAALAQAYRDRGGLVRRRADEIAGNDRMQARSLYRRAADCERLALRLDKKVRRGRRTNISWRPPQPVVIARILGFELDPIHAHIAEQKAEDARQKALAKLTRAIAVSPAAGLAVGHEIVAEHPSLRREVVKRVAQAIEPRLHRRDHGLSHSGKLPQPRPATAAEAYDEALGAETPTAMLWRDMLASLEGRPVGVVVVPSTSQLVAEQEGSVEGDQTR